MARTVLSIPTSFAVCWKCPHAALLLKQLFASTWWEPHQLSPDCSGNLLARSVTAVELGREGEHFEFLVNCIVLDDPKRPIPLTSSSGHIFNSICFYRYLFWKTYRGILEKMRRDSASQYGSVPLVFLQACSFWGEKVEKGRFPGNRFTLQDLRHFREGVGVL